MSYDMAVTQLGRARKICSEGLCPNFQPCPTHGRAAWEGSTRRQRLPPGWERLRLYILIRDPICRDGRVCNRQALSAEVDHIVAGDDHRSRNLQGICVPCHKAKTQAEAAQARRREA